MPWIIGDIHGCLKELNALLCRIPEDAPLIFLGDYIDRGPDSKGVVDRVLKEKHRSVYLMGNHEEMLRNHFKSQQTRTGWLYEINGGRKTLESYGLPATAGPEKLPPDHYDFFFKKLKLIYEGDDFIAVHAGLRVTKGSDQSKQKKRDMLWIREEWLFKQNQWKGKYVYFGHTPTNYLIPGHDRPIIGKKACALDTGCVYGGSLTAIHHPDHRVIQVPCSMDRD